MSTLHFREGGREKQGQRQRQTETERDRERQRESSLKSPLCISLRILRDALIVLIRDSCIDINFISLFCCQQLSCFYRSKLTLGDTSFVFILLQFFLIVFANSRFAGLSRPGSVSTQLIFEKSHSYIAVSD